MPESFGGGLAVLPLYAPRPPPLGFCAWPVGLLARSTSNGPVERPSLPTLRNVFNGDRLSVRHGYQNSKSNAFALYGLVLTLAYWDCHAEGLAACCTRELAASLQSGLPQIDGQESSCIDAMVAPIQEQFAQIAAGINAAPVGPANLDKMWLALGAWHPLRGSRKLLGIVSMRSRLRRRGKAICLC